MRPSLRIAALAVVSTALLSGRAGMASPPTQAQLTAGCSPFFAAALKPPVAMPRMRMHGMQMLDAASGPLPLVCLTVKDPFQPPAFKDIGRPTIQVSSDSTVQSYFDQGLRFYMGFNNRESYRAFRYAAVHAVEVGKPCAWCYWGAALPLGSDINMPNELDLDRKTANGYLTLASDLKPTGLLAELIKALQQRSQDCDKSTPECHKLRSDGYYEAMRRINLAQPHDPNVGVLFADSILNLTPWHLPDEEKFKTARKTLETLMDANPQHNGLIHWYIHLMELSRTPRDADSRARQLAALAPAAGHLVHMPSHIYYRIGDMRRAIASNVDASTADRAYFDDPRNQLEHPDGDRYKYGYYPHTLHFLAAAANLFGDKRSLNDATDWLYKSPPPDAQGYRKDKYREVYYLARVNLASTDEIRKFAKPDGSSAVQPRGNAAYAYTQVMADLWDKKFPTTSRDRFDDAKRNYPIVGDPDDACRDSIKTNGDTGLCMVAIENNLVNARIGAFAQNWDAAVHFTQQAVDLQSALSYDEPPDWLYSLHQSHAAMLILKAIAEGADKPASQEALRRAKQELLDSLDPDTNRSDVFPGSGWAYFGLWQVAQHLKGEDPAAAKLAFLNHWISLDQKTFPTLERM